MKEKEEEGKYTIKKDRGKKKEEDLPSFTTSPNFQNSGGIITDTEYEVKSEIEEEKKEETTS